MANRGHGKKIELFLVNGTADSIVTAETINWSGLAIKIPRIEVIDCQREDIKQPGVYFLFCKGDGDKDSVYIGESENVKQRLVQHMNSYASHKEKYYWTTAVIFTGRSLNKASIRYLETRLVEIATKAHRYKIITKATTNNPVLKESDKAAMEEFIDNIKILLNTLGYKVLEELVKKKDKYYYFKTANSNGKGIPTVDGFVVFKGAKFSDKEPAKSLTKKQKEYRQKLLASDKVKEFIAQEDIIFLSPSAAATYLCGSSTSGPLHWKDKNGRSLKENESAEQNVPQE